MPLTLKPLLLQTHNLTFYRQNPGTLQPEGYYSDDGPPTELPDIKGSLQPIRSGLRVNIIPEGYDTDSGFFWFTEYLHRSFKEGSGQLPDYTVIDDRQYEVHNYEDWSGFSLSTDHNKYILIAKSMNPEGGGFV